MLSIGEIPKVRTVDGAVGGAHLIAPWAPFGTGAAIHGKFKGFERACALGDPVCAACK